ncbi:hypothetical protein K2X14_07825 [Acetobacter sp. TBRC 12305]|uniref:Uncharacterized protein n=1 Tax=Acetobacter garciniae TaxID=2817435 RepID=A0A939KQG0_9PROT|nr:hypothetical protein [Acetobacter garciniae]MBO1325287.1 hypothetical protein [Acetobacter garciniae]MBX0344741.1 hypothetical protein [Acetobacter garciniae]
MACAPAPPRPNPPPMPEISAVRGRPRKGETSEQASARREAARVSKSFAPLTLCPAHLAGRQHNAANRRKIDLFRAMADTLFANADQMEQWRKACAASNNPDGAATWQRLANHTRNEAHEYVRRADRLQEHAR